MAISKAECKRVALETLIRIAKTDTGEALSAAEMLLSYANPNWRGYFPVTAPTPTDGPKDSPADEGDE